MQLQGALGMSAAGRAWHRVGTPDVTGTRPEGAAKGAILAFLRELADDGALNAGTASIYQTAIHHVLDGQSDDEWVPLDRTSVDAALERTRLRLSARLKTATIETYCSTYRRVVAVFAALSHLPRGERPPAVSRRHSLPRVARARSRGPSVEYSLPLAGERMAQVRVPSNLTLAEAKRLGALLELVCEAAEPQGGPASPDLDPASRGWSSGEDHAG
jgi:hypothetical protein